MEESRRSPGGVRRSQEELGRARLEPGGARGAQEEPPGSSWLLLDPRAPHGHLGASRSSGSPYKGF